MTNTEAPRPAYLVYAFYATKPMLPIATNSAEAAVAMAGHVVREDGAYKAQILRHLDGNRYEEVGVRRSYPQGFCQEA
jgi:hypothetical protein